MTTQEMIFVHNWVEQFRGQAQTPSRWSRSGSWFARRPVDSLYSSCTPAGVIFSAFPWEETDEGRSVWSDRHDHIYHNELSR